MTAYSHRTQPRSRIEICFNIVHALTIVQVSEKTGLQSVHPKATQMCSSPSLFRCRNRYEPLKLDEDLTASDISTGASLCSYKNSSRPTDAKVVRFLLLHSVHNRQFNTILYVLESIT